MSRALVLGGGGPVGIAWESGLINGLADGGVDVSKADFIMGTSAGSFVGARLALGHNPKDLAAAFMAPAPERPQPAASQAAPAAAPPDLTGLMKMMQDAQSGAVPADQAMKALGKYALEAKTVPEDAFVASFGAAWRDLADNVWPPRAYACTAVDVESGEFKFWTADEKVSLKHAVASSCSVPGIYPPITIKGRRYMDGGMRSATNADLATGYDKVLCIVVRVDAPGPMGERMRERLDREYQVLRDGGAEVFSLAPDEASVKAFGVNLMDARRRGPAAAAGLAQGRAQAAALAKFWN